MNGGQDALSENRTRKWHENAPDWGDLTAYRTAVGNIRLTGALILGRYRMERRLGAGGFGVVWLAWDEKLEREVAVKVIPRERGEGERVEREARAAARLNHPGIVAIYELASDDARRVPGLGARSGPNARGADARPARSRIATWRASGSRSARRSTTRTRAG